MERYLDMPYVYYHKSQLQNGCYTIIIPANCTDRLQPLDLSVNKAAKDFLRTQFSNWHADQICSQL